MNFRELEAIKLQESTFKLIGTDWMLITGEKNGKINTMTASWGGLGIMWGKEVAFIVVRPQRYTKEFIDNDGYFTLTFFDEKYKKELKYLGTVSGRDEDKVTKSMLTVSYIENNPYFEEGKLVLSCKKLYSQCLTADNFEDKTLLSKWYPNEDYHEMYIAEINKILIK